MERNHQKNDHHTGPMHGVKANEQHQRTNAQEFEKEKGQISGQEQQHGMHAEHHNKTKAPSTHSHKITIYVDHQPFYVDNPKVSGADIRNLTQPPIGPEKDIFHVLSGTDEKVKMGNGDVIAINPNESKHGRHFVTQATAGEQNLRENGLHLKPSNEEIALVAYAIYEERGYPQGQDQAHWLEAEYQLKNRSTEQNNRFVSFMAGSGVKV